MPLVSAKVKTWICDKYPSECQHRWQFSEEALNSSPYDFTDDDLKRHFPERQFIGLRPGKCPACHTRGVSSPLALAVDLADMSQVSVGSDAELEAQEVDLDEVEQVAERYRLNPQNGQVEKVPVVGRKKRPLTTKELEDLKLQRDQSLDKLEDIAVKEV